ncbi:MAG: LCP family protein, partial [Chloroflexota bacterium]|nr:LCP family protein [Chloroflexota bacterium]
MQHSAAGNSNSTIQRLFTAGLIVVFLTVAAMAGLFVFDQVRQLIAASDMLSGPQEPDAASEVEWDPQKDPLPVWKGTKRVNILVMGIDQRGHEQGPWRTDTMLVLTIDPVSMTGGMLSIPRDLWVPIPGYEEGRINTAHYLGDLYDYPGGGPALAAKTVQYNLGVHIHHYARVNFTAFEEVVDRIGGIDIYVEEEINDPTYPSSDPADPYSYDPLYITAGWQHFDGEMALKYARTRHSEGGDFDRAKRQQKVMMAVFEQITRLDMLPQLASQAPDLWQMLEDSVVTDLALDKIVALARLASEVKPEDIRYAVIDEHYTQFWETTDGQQVLIPLRDGIRELRDSIFTTDVPLPEQEGDPAARLAAEAASIEVLNGTVTEGLAGSVSEYLQQQGIQITNISNADRADYVESLVIVYTGKTYTAEYLVGLLDLPPT